MIASPAATSHSLTGARRGYTSAVPSAIWHNLMADPLGVFRVICRPLRNASVFGSRWDRLTAAAASEEGQGRGRMEVIALALAAGSPGARLRRCAPPPAAVLHNIPSAGA